MASGWLSTNTGTVVCQETGQQRLTGVDILWDIRRYPIRRLSPQTNESLIEVGTALNIALDCLDQMRDLRDAYRSKVNEIFRDDMKNPVALLFKRGHHSAGSFGALDEFHVLPRPNPVMTLLAVFGEALRVRDGRLSGPDKSWAVS